MFEENLLDRLKKYEADIQDVCAKLGATRTYSKKRKDFEEFLGHLYDSFPELLEQRNERYFYPEEFR